MSVTPTPDRPSTCGLALCAENAWCSEDPRAVCVMAWKEKQRAGGSDVVSIVIGSHRARREALTYGEGCRLAAGLVGLVDMIR